MIVSRSHLVRGYPDQRHDQTRLTHVLQRGMTQLTHGVETPTVYVGVLTNGDSEPVATRCLFPPFLPLRLVQQPRLPDDGGYKHLGIVERVAALTASRAAPRIHHAL